MSTLLKPLQIRAELLSRNLRIITPREIKQIFGLAPWQSKYLLSKRELFLPLRQGLYALQTDLPGEEEIANHLYQPSYISLEYALNKYNILPEAVYTVTCVTTKPTRTFKNFSFLSIKKSAYAGYFLANHVLIAEPEKALVDFWYFVSLGKKKDNDRLNLTGLNKDKILKYAKLFDRPGLIKLTKKRL